MRGMGKSRLRPLSRLSSGTSRRGIPLRTRFGSNIRYFAPCTYVANCEVHLRNDYDARTSNVNGDENVRLHVSTRHEEKFIIAS